MNDEFRRVAGLLHDADEYAELFSTADKSVIRTEYRSMLKVIHPDRVDQAYQPEANEVMGKLARFYEAAVQAVDDGTFGAPKPVLTITSAMFRHYCVNKLNGWFDMATGFVARSEDGSGLHDTFVKLARYPRDNDLLIQETESLRVLATTGNEHRMYYPTLLDSTAVPDGRRRLRVNVVKQLDGFFNLEKVASRYPNGIHPLDMGWIWRRVLWALGGAHEADVLHGALVPSHIMIQPTLHGVVLVDWCYSVRRSGGDYPALSAIVGRHRDWYASPVLHHTPPTESLDLAFAARCMRYVMGAQPIPDAMNRYFSSIITEATQASAYELLAQFDRILERLGAPYYPRSYRPLNW